MSPRGECPCATHSCWPARLVAFPSRLPSGGLKLSDNSCGDTPVSSQVVRGPASSSRGAGIVGRGAAPGGLCARVEAAEAGSPGPAFRRPQRQAGGTHWPGGRASSHCAELLQCGQLATCRGLFKQNAHVHLTSQQGPEEDAVPPFASQTNLLRRREPREVARPAHGGQAQPVHHRDVPPPQATLLWGPVASVSRGANPAPEDVQVWSQPTDAPATRFSRRPVPGHRPKRSRPFPQAPATRCPAAWDRS